MMRSKLLLAAFVLFSLGLLAGRAEACSCGGGEPPCSGQLRYLQRAGGTVFAATVSELKPVYADAGSDPEADAFPTSYRVRLVVDEMLIGGEAKELEVRTSNSTASCGYDFKVGMRYLVYATREAGGALGVSLCSRTRPLEDASDDLEMLRAARRGEEPQARIFGYVYVQAEQTERAQRGEPPDRTGIKIVATSADGQQFETLTDERGRFRLTRLPFGRYKVRAWLNEQMSKEWGVELPLSEESSCRELGFHFRPGARVTGAVSDADGRPLPTQLYVYVKLIAPTKGRPESLNTGLFGTLTDGLGRFEFDGLPPGRYAVGLRPGLKQEEGTPDFLIYKLESKSSFVLARGQNLEGLTLRRPARMELVTIEGAARWPDGRPADAVIVIEDADTGWVFQQHRVEENGRFKWKLFAGQTYRVYAYNFQFDLYDGQFSKSVTLVAGERGSPPLEFRLAWPPGYERELLRKSQ